MPKQSHKERIRQLELLLYKCMVQFQWYASIHAAKETPEGDRKANANMKLARDIAEVLGPSYHAEPPTPLRKGHGT